MKLSHGNNAAPSEEQKMNNFDMMPEDVTAMICRKVISPSTGLIFTFPRVNSLDARHELDRVLQAVISRYLYLQRVSKRFRRVIETIHLDWIYFYTGIEPRGRFIHHLAIEDDYGYPKRVPETRPVIPNDPRPLLNVARRITINDLLYMELQSKLRQFMLSHDLYVVGNGKLVRQKASSLQLMMIEIDDKRIREEFHMIINERDILLYERKTQRDLLKELARNSIVASNDSCQPWLARPCRVFEPEEMKKKLGLHGDSVVVRWDSSGDEFLFL